MEMVNHNKTRLANISRELFDISVVTRVYECINFAHSIGDEEKVKKLTKSFRHPWAIMIYSILEENGENNEIPQIEIAKQIYLAENGSAPTRRELSKYRLTSQRIIDNFEDIGLVETYFKPTPYFGGRTRVVRFKTTIENLVGSPLSVIRSVITRLDRSINFAHSIGDEEKVKKLTKSFRHPWAIMIYSILEENGQNNEIPQIEIAKQIYLAENGSAPSKSELNKYGVTTSRIIDNFEDIGLVETYFKSTPYFGGSGRTRVVRFKTSIEKYVGFF
jgi:hypothetical protein